MEKIIKETTEKLSKGIITKDDANKILLDLFDVINSSCDIEKMVDKNKQYVLGFYTGDELREYLSKYY